MTNVASADVRLAGRARLLLRHDPRPRLRRPEPRRHLQRRRRATPRWASPACASSRRTGRLSSPTLGRFTLPCEALPRAGGQPFQLKLDERTLPAGFEMTTENPLVVRLTAGTVVQMSFGATLPEQRRGHHRRHRRDGAATADRLTAPERATVEASRALDALGIRVQFSGLDAQPRLNVATSTLPTRPHRDRASPSRPRRTTRAGSRERTRDLRHADAGHRRPPADAPERHRHMDAPGRPEPGLRARGLRRAGAPRHHPAPAARDPAEPDRPAATGPSRASCPRTARSNAASRCRADRSSYRARTYRPAPRSRSWAKPSSPALARPSRSTASCHPAPTASPSQAAGRRSQTVDIPRAECS